jgi:hypothetical protein
MEAVGFFPLLCTIQVRSEVRTPNGSLSSPDTWTGVQGYIGIPCRFVNKHGVEPRYLWGQAENEPIQIALNSRYEGIDAATMRAHITDPANAAQEHDFNIVSVAGDSSGAYTILVARDYAPTVDAGL